MNHSSAFRAFMHGLIDYAGLFPPANLSLPEALEEYSRYLPGADNWMLGRFIIPAARLSELPPLTGPWRFSVLGRGGSDSAEFVRGLETDLVCLGEFRQSQSAEVFEVRLPTSVLGSHKETSGLMDQAGDQLTSQNGLTVYYEVPLDDHWNDNLTAAIAAIAEYNRQIGHRNGFKLRCGGVVASAFPSSEQIAHALILCRDHDVPLKATAGLHHPIRHYNESVQTKMHGFINVFAAGILADVHQLSIDQTTAIINDEESGHFSFTESHFNWKNISATADQIASIRDARLIAYGSCSFDEPRDDLRALGWL